MGRALLIGGGILSLAIGVLIVAWLLVGEGPPARAGPGQAPYGGGMIQQAISAEQYAERTVREAEINRAIKLYEVEHGQYPEALEELERVPQLPDGLRWEYDPDIGQARVVDSD